MASDEENPAHYSPWWHSVSCVCEGCLMSDELVFFTWDFREGWHPYDTFRLFERPLDDESEIRSPLQEWEESLPHGPEDDS